MLKVSITYQSECTLMRECNTLNFYEKFIVEPAGNRSARQMPIFNTHCKLMLPKLQHMLEMYSGVMHTLLVRA
jgi:hypothetical protein